jgi:hypothetical protein
MQFLAASNFALTKGGNMIFTTEQRNGAGQGVQLPTTTPVPSAIKLLMNRLGI